MPKYQIGTEENRIMGSVAEGLDNVGSLFGSIAKGLGKVAKGAGKGVTSVAKGTASLAMKASDNPIAASLISTVPGGGSVVAAAQYGKLALGTLNKAKAGDQQAQLALEDVKNKAAAGNPQAIEAAKSITNINALAESKKREAERKQPPKLAKPQPGDAPPGWKWGPDGHLYAVKPFRVVKPNVYRPTRYFEGVVT